MKNRYHLTNITRQIATGNKVHTLRRIQSDAYFNDVRPGDYGGWIEVYGNLLTNGNCWIYDDAMVYGLSVVKDNAIIRNNAILSGATIAKDSSIIGGYAEVKNVMVSENAIVTDNVIIQGNNNLTKIKDNSIICGKTKIFGESIIQHRAFIGGDSEITSSEINGYSRINGMEIYKSKIENLDALEFHRAVIKEGFVIDNSSIIVISPIGSRLDTLTAYNSIDDVEKIMVTTGCFTGDIQKFENKVNEEHNCSIIQDEYLAAIALIKTKLNIK